MLFPRVVTMLLISASIPTKAFNVLHRLGVRPALSSNSRKCNLCNLVMVDGREARVIDVRVRVQMCVYM